MRFMLVLALIGVLLIIGAFLPAQAQDGVDWADGRSPVELGEQYHRGFTVSAPQAIGFYRALSGLGAAVPAISFDYEPGPFWHYVGERGLHLRHGGGEADDAHSIRNRFDNYGGCRTDYLEADFERLSIGLGSDAAYLEAWVKDRLSLLALCSMGGAGPAPEHWAVERLGGDASPERTRADAAYFDAVHAFYSHDVPRAVALFKAIAADPGNVHRDAARTTLVEIWSGADWVLPDVEPDFASVRALLADWREESPSAMSRLSYEVALGTLTYHSRASEDAALDAASFTSLLDVRNSVFHDDPVELARFLRVLEDSNRFFCLGWRSDTCPDGPRSAAVMERIEGNPALTFFDQALNRSRIARPIAEAPMRQIPVSDADLPDRAANVFPRDSLLWLVLVQEFASPDAPIVGELEERALALATAVAEGAASLPEQVAWPSVFSNRLRLLVQGGRHTAALNWFTAHAGSLSEEYLRWIHCDWGAREILFGTLDRARDVMALMPSQSADPDGWTHCDGTLRFFVAATPEQADRAIAGRTAPRVVAGYLDLIPTDRMMELIDSDTIWPEMRIAAVRALIGRGLLLRKEGWWSTGLNILHSDLEPDVAEELAGLGRGEMRFGLPYPENIAMLLLRYPRLRLQVYRPLWGLIYPEDEENLGRWRAIDVWQHSANNHWCRYDPNVSRLGLHEPFHQILSYFGRLPVDTDAAIERVMAAHPIQKLIDFDEIAERQEIDPSPVYLPRAALGLVDGAGSGAAYADLSRHQLAEALHLAVKATRYACPAAEGRGRLSRETYTILHRQFGDTEWATRTPYWFDRAH